jgi:hypothetical protein
MDTGTILLLGFIWLLNFVISWWNAYVTGKIWLHTKGSPIHFMTWMGYIMSMAGFSWCFLIPIGLGANYFDFLTNHQLKLFFDLGYVILAPVICFAGLAITVESWMNAIRERTFLSTAVAGYNTFAQISNMVSMFENIGPAVDGVGELFSSSSSDSDDAGPVMLIVLLVAAALVGGIVLASVIVVKTAKGEARRFSSEWKQRQNAHEES